MKFFSTAISTAVLGLFISSTVAAPAANAIEARDDCVVNAAIINDWAEDGLRRYRVAFSTTKAGVDMKSAGCSYWHLADPGTNCGAIQNNVACYDSSAADSWVVDQNEVAGPAGKTAIDCMVNNFITVFAGNTGCRAG